MKYFTLLFFILFSVKGNAQEDAGENRTLIRVLSYNNLENGK